MKKIFFLLCTMATLWSCTSDDFDTNDKTAETQHITVNATFEADADSASATRTSLASGNKVVWDEGDEITLFSIDGTSLTDASKSTKGKLTLTDGAGTTNGTFVGDAQVSERGYFAVYPYVENTKIYSSTAYPKGYASVSGLDLTTQEAREGSIPSNVPMIAYTNTTLTGNKIQLQFKNVFAYIKFTVQYNCKSVRIAPNASDNDPLMLSSFNLIMDGDTPALLGESPENNYVTLEHEDGSNITPGTYYVAVNPVELKSGFTITFTSIDGETTLKKSSGKSTTLTRNKILNLGVIDISSIPCLNGKGTSSAPYQISSFGDLQTMQALIGSSAAPQTGCTAYASAYYKQTANLDCKGGSLTPIGTTNSNYFTGTYDGDSHTISNISYPSTSISGGSYRISSLFGVIRNASIKNLSVKNAHMETSTATYPMVCASPLVGVACSDEDETNFITNCHVSYDESSSYNLHVYGGVCYGGIIANSNSNTKISQCSSNINMTIEPDVESDLHRYWVGGLVGSAIAYATEVSGSRTGHNTDLVIEKSRNKGSFTIIGQSCSPLALGGILGYVEDKGGDGDVRTLVVTCVNSGDLKATGSGTFSGDVFIGGIIGEMNSDGYVNSSLESVNPYITNCLNTGNLSSTEGAVYGGGISGCVFDSDTEFQYCVNTGDLNCANNKSTNGYYLSITGHTTIEKCYTTTPAECNPDSEYKSDLTVSYMNGIVGVPSYAIWTIDDSGTWDLKF